MTKSKHSKPADATRTKAVAAESSSAATSETPTAQPALIGISISDSPDLDRLGFGKEHLSELMGSIARAVLRLRPAQTHAQTGAQTDEGYGAETALAYGGDLRPGGATRYLFDVVATERAESTEARPEPPRRLYSYLGWPYYLSLSKPHEAQMINICHFIRVTPRQAGFSEIPDRRREAEQTDPPKALVASRCLTRMRELATHGGHPDFDGVPAPPLRARILLGGATAGYSSFMPGLFEEFLIAREPGPNGRPPLPVYVIGAFGGAAGQLAAALLDPANANPLTLEYQLEQDAKGTQPDRLAALLDLYQKHAMPLEPKDRYQALRDCIDRLGALIRGNDRDALDNGLTPIENRTLLQTRDEVEIRRLIQKGLGNIG